MVASTVETRFVAGDPCSATVGPVSGARAFRPMPSRRGPDSRRPRPRSYRPPTRAPMRSSPPRARTLGLAGRSHCRTPTRGRGKSSSKAASIGKAAVAKFRCPFRSGAPADLGGAKTVQSGRPCTPPISMSFNIRHGAPAGVLIFCRGFEPLPQSVGECLGIRYRSGSTASQKTSRVDRARVPRPMRIGNAAAAGSSTE